MCVTLIGGLGPALAAFLARFKETLGEISFCHFLHLLRLYLTALDAASLRGRRGLYARTPSGSCARFYYITRGFLMSVGERKMAKSDHVAKKAASAGPSPPISVTHTEDQC